MNELDLFVAAVAISNPSDQAAFLDRECQGNPALRQRLSALLAASKQPRNSLDPPSADLSVTGAGDLGESTGASPDAESDQVIAGKYTLTQRIGEGGMGSVWLAHQSEPVKRKVAVKLIKAGMDSRQVLARFEAERQALAVMDHPNIAKVLDGGLHEGRPFFVMELVKGVPITEYCDKCKLTPKERLELFVPVCQAIQHAHQKGIIHRDIKPSNVLVALYDDKPVPKVIDFGIAKATGGALTEHTIETAFGGVVGTPQYMSPEQASLNNLDIDTRSDVYSLGVLLYELLTGSPPFARKELQKAGLLEILRVVREEEPPRPSTKLSTADALPSLSASRGTEPKKLTGLLRNELDWIVMKALEKDRARRYETANGFAADVNRFLNGEAVQAHPPSTAYRVKKFVRRNRGQVIAASLVLVSLLAGIAGTTAGLIEARRQAAIARDETLAKEAARESEVRQHAVAVDEKRKAEASAEKAMETFRESTDDGIEQLIGSKRELGPLEEGYLRRTLERWRAFASQAGYDERNAAIRGEAHYRVGSLWLKLGRSEEARAEIETALGIFAKLAHASPANIHYQNQLASSHHDLALVRDDSPGQVDEARELLETAIRLQRPLVEASPHLPLLRQHLANFHHSLGNHYGRSGRSLDASREHEIARDLLAKLVSEHPDVAAYRHRLGTARNDLATALGSLGEHIAAEKEFVAAIELQEALVKDLPHVPMFHDELATTRNNFGYWWSLRGDPEKACREYETARGIYKRLAESFPAVAAHQVMLGRTCANVGAAMRDLGDPAEALKPIDEAVRILSAAHQRRPRDRETRDLLAWSHMVRATTFRLLGKHAKAVGDYDRSIELCSDADRPARRAARANMLVKAGRVKDAVAEVADLTKSPDWDADQWYNFACVHALASRDMTPEMQGQADRAMELLNRAKSSRYMTPLHVSQDTDLDPIRNRDDFRKLVTELETNFPAKKDVPTN